jgi:hypothetical protein
MHRARGFSRMTARIAPRRSGVRVPLAPLKKPLVIRGFCRSGARAQGRISAKRSRNQPVSLQKCVQDRARRGIRMPTQRGSGSHATPRRAPPCRRMRNAAAPLAGRSRTVEGATREQKRIAMNAQVPANALRQGVAAPERQQGVDVRWASPGADPIASSGASRMVNAAARHQLGRAADVRLHGLRRRRGRIAV